MKNILIISSSPRKNGNSQILCEQFKKGAEAKGHQVEIVRIMEQNIGFCRACDGCMRNGGTCVLKDDMAEILKMFQKADWCCTIKVDIGNSKSQYIEMDKQEATKDGSESTKIQHGI